MQYQEKGMVITVARDRYTYGAPDAVRGHAGNNEGFYEINAQEAAFTFGPCMVESITLTRARKIANTWTRQFVESLNEMSKPSIHRYMMLDGQRLVLAQCENTPPLLFADSHASFDNDLWLGQFPEEHRG